MKIIFDPKPVKTFALQISFNIGWRHEPPKEKGVIRKELQGLLNLILNTLPSWFDGFYHLDAEFSSLIILGLSEDQGRIPKLLQVIENNFPEGFSGMGAGIEMGVLSGGIKKDIVNVIEEFQTEHIGRKLTIHSAPKRFLNVRNLTRAQKHFLVSVMLKKGNELFLEVSPRGDRIQYGMKLDDVALENLDEALRSYEHWIRRRFESTKDSVALLTLMNIYEKIDKDLEDVIKEVYSVNIVALNEAIRKLSAISKKMIM